VEVVGSAIVTIITGFIMGRMWWIVLTVKNVSFVMNVWIVLDVMGVIFVRTAKTVGIVCSAMIVLGVKIVLGVLGWCVGNTCFLMSRFRKRNMKSLKRIFRKQI